MPYKNAYNKEIAQKTRFPSQDNVKRDKEINDLCYKLLDSVTSGVVGATPSGNARR